MAETNPEETSSTVREQGNVLYKEGKIVEAANAYIKASKLDPKDPKPLSNLSAMYFEMGLYPQCIRSISSTMALQLSPEDRESFNLKLSHRLVKSALHFRRFQKVREMVEHPNSTNADYEVYRTVLRQVDAMKAALPKEEEVRRRIVMQLPRYRPFTNTAIEYYTFGHDDACSLFDESLASIAIKDGVSMFFAGIGDARNLYATLISLARHEMKSEKPIKNIHITINDVQAPAIARDLIIISLIEQLARSLDSTEDEKSLITITIFYVYCGHVLPPFAFDHLQKTIAALLKKLEGTLQPSNVITIQSRDRRAIVDALVSWQGEIPNLIDKTEVTDHIIHTSGNELINSMPAPRGCEKERSFWSSTAGLFLPKSHRGKMKTYDLEKAIRQDWKINVTLFDIVWESLDVDRDCFFYPFDVADKFYLQTGLKHPETPTCLYDYVAPFFVEIAHAMKHLDGRLCIEAICGELSAVMEMMRYGLLDHRNKDHGDKSDVRSLPAQYDRIHMSNIPDYIGGSLTSFLYAIPITTSDPSAWITSNCLRNSGIWQEVEDFNNEYLAIHDSQEIQRLFQVVQVKKKDMSGMFGGMFGNLLKEPFPLGDYINWRRFRSTGFPFSNLLPRSSVQKWLLRLFVKLAVPANKESLAINNYIYNPLNLTVYFRLLSHLHEIGYPGHWFGDCLVKLLEDDNVTTVRPPRSAPLEIEETEQDFPARKVAVVPYIPELSTLTAIFQRILPFAVITDCVPLVTDIHLNTLGFTGVNYDRGSMPVTNILFSQKQLFQDACASLTATMDLRPLFDPPEGEKEARPLKYVKLQKLREHGLALWSTFEWDRSSESATVWMRKDFVEKMKADSEWQCCLMRTDWWKIISTPQAVYQAIEEGKSWVDEIETT